MQSRKLKCVIVEWTDVTHYSETHSIREVKMLGVLKMSTIGFVTCDGRRTLKVTHELNDDGYARNTTVIPREYITKIIPLYDRRA